MDKVIIILIIFFTVYVSASKTEDRSIYRDTETHPNGYQCQDSNLMSVRLFRQNDGYGEDKIETQLLTEAIDLNGNPVFVAHYSTPTPENNVIDALSYDKFGALLANVYSQTRVNGGNPDGPPAEMLFSVKTYKFSKNSSTLEFTEKRSFLDLSDPYVKHFDWWLKEAQPQQIKTCKYQKVCKSGPWDCRGKPENSSCTWMGPFGRTEDGICITNGSSQCFCVQSN